MSQADWHVHFMSIAALCAAKSKDPSTKTGAVIVNNYNVIVGSGYNGFPRDVPDDANLLNNREEKYPRILHAELNAILNASSSLRGCRIYVWPAPSCSQCAAAIIQSGIKQEICPSMPKDYSSRWASSVKTSQDMFHRARVQQYVIEFVQIRAEIQGHLYRAYELAAELD